MGEGLVSAYCDSVVISPAYDILREEYHAVTCTGDSATATVPTRGTQNRLVSTKCAYHHCKPDSVAKTAYCIP